MKIILTLLLLCAASINFGQTVVASDDAEAYSGTDYTDENNGTGFSSGFIFNLFGTTDNGNEFIESTGFQIGGNKSFGLAAGETGTGKAVTRPFSSEINSLHRIECKVRFNIDVNAGQTAGFLISDATPDGSQYWTTGQVLFLGTSGNGYWVYDDDGASVNPINVKDPLNNDFPVAAGDAYKITLDINPSSTGTLADQYAFQIENLKNSDVSAITVGNLIGGTIKSIGYGNGNIGQLKNLIWDDIVVTSDPANPLPVELSSFTASVLNNTVLLKWRTETEVNNYGFEIERKTGSRQSAVGEWEQIAFIEGFGNSNSPKEYSFEDNLSLTHTLNLTPALYYRLRQIDNDGSFNYSNVVEVFIGEIPDGFLLEQNYPNPFNPSTKIRFAVDKSVHTALKVYDALGKHIVTLFDAIADAGRIYEVEFSTKGGSSIGGNVLDLQSGVYYYRLVAGENQSTKKMILLH
jgi:hypothetical protein